MVQDVECGGVPGMNHDERIKIINQYRTGGKKYTSSHDVKRVYIFFMNSMWLAVTNPNACRQAIIQKAYHTSEGVVIK